jgi:hypothetical protein
MRALLRPFQSPLAIDSALERHTAGGALHDRRLNSDKSIAMQSVPIAPIAYPPATTDVASKARANPITWINGST